MSADPDSFEETRFNRTALPVGSLCWRHRLTSNYGRVGPDIRGNTLLLNSVNGLFRPRPNGTWTRNHQPECGRRDLMIPISCTYLGENLLIVVHLVVHGPKQLRLP